MSALERRPAYHERCVDVKQAQVAANLAGAGGSLRDTLHRLTRTAGLVLLTSVFLACGSSGLSAGEWVWCKENPPAVDAAAASLQVATAQRTFKEPTWWQDYLTTALSQNSAALTANPDFVASCKAAADKAGVDEKNVAWCMADGIGETWDAAVSLSLTTDVSADTFAYRAVPLQQRINDADFDRACKQAFSTRTS
jgi:hypothetical protein